MEYLYVVISETSTGTGKFIRFMTKEKYNHVSISLQPSLQPLYAFSRYYLRLPFFGGFTEESWLRYQQHNDYLNVIVYKVPLAAEQKNDLAAYLAELNEHRLDYRYSLLGAINCYFPQKNYRPLNKYTCLGFAVKILQDLQAIPSDKPIFSIVTLQKKLSRYPHYKKQIQFRNLAGLHWGTDQYLHNRKIIPAFLGSLSHRLHSLKKFF